MNCIYSPYMYSAVVYLNFLNFFFAWLYLCEVLRETNTYVFHVQFRGKSILLSGKLIKNQENY